MDPLTISTIAGLGKSLIGRIWPDPAQQAEQLHKLAELEQRGDLAALNAHVQLMVGQLEINKIEAASNSIFIAGWRPFIGWVGGVALAYQFVLYPMLLWVMTLKGVPLDNAPPVLDTGALFSIVTAMLGVGAMRSHDKRHGADTKRIRGRAENL